MKQTSKWYRTQNKPGQFIIRRDAYPDGKLKRELYPKQKYQDTDISDDDKCAALLRKLNANYERQKKEAEARYDLDNTFFNKPLVEEFMQVRMLEVTGRDQLKSIVTYLRSVFEYFVIKKKLPDPDTWAKHQLSFGEHLLKQEYSLSYIQRAQIETNRYLLFLHKKLPHQVPLLDLMFVAPAKKKLIIANKEMDGDVSGAVITEPHYKLLVRYGGLLRQHIQLAWSFGARRAEVLGLELSNVRVDNLRITRQLDSYKDEEPIFTPTKGRLQRKTPYWFTTPAYAYEWIKHMKLMHPDTLSDKFVELIAHINKLEQLEMDYTFHDFRRSFITYAYRNQRRLGIESEDIADAVGHKDVRTTQLYREDDRNLSDEIFTPL